MNPTSVVGYTSCDLTLGRVGVFGGPLARQAGQRQKRVAVQTQLEEVPCESTRSLLSFVHTAFKIYEIGAASSTRPVHLRLLMAKTTRLYCLDLRLITQRRPRRSLLVRMCHGILIARVVSLIVQRTAHRAHTAYRVTLLGLCDESSQRMWRVACGQLPILLTWATHPLGRRFAHVPPYLCMISDLFGS